MPKMIAIVIEFAALIGIFWVLWFLSTFLHEFGHALGYMLATGDWHWHIRVGWGKRLLNTKALTVNLFVFDGFFIFLNLFILVLSLLPIRYFFGEIKGLETDGLQIIHALKKQKD